MSETTAAVIVNELQAKKDAGVRSIGEIITWSVGLNGRKVPYTKIAESLRACELPDKYARQLCNRYAFARACRKLQQQRIIRIVKVEGDLMTFQFTAETKPGEGVDRFNYELETMLTLNKKSGEITCGIPGIATTAKEMLEDCIGNRTASDITNIVQRLFGTHADLFQVRDQGGAYFVPEMHLDFVGKVERFLVVMGGKMNRFPIPEGTANGDAAVKDVVAAGLAAMITKHREAISNFGQETGERAVEGQAKRIEATRFKLKCYAAYLEERREWLESELDRANDDLRVKFSAFASKAEAA